MTDNTTANVWGDILRVIYRLLDTVVYWLLGLMYQIFFNVASAELFTNETVKNFYGRVQLIIGVFMIFKLAVSIVKGIVNPDTFTDKKSGGASIITRVIFALVMLTIIVPINIPNASSEYEIQLNNNGLLFGTLYSLQHRILANNTLGKLILGTTDGQTNTIDNAISSNDNEQLKKSANLFTSTILKGFIRINLKEGKEDETKKENWMCENDLSNDALNEYKKLDADPETIIEMTTLKCDAPDAGVIASIINSDQRYMFAYKGLISAIVGGVFVYILLNFTIDIAVRAIKLAILRLIAPIPIISYIDPGTGAKTFESWTKNLTSTYIDLFLRLAIIYFVIFLIQDIIVNGIVVNTATGVVGFLTYIFIFLGLFIFAKQAPKFIKQIFGMKDDGGKMFGGLGEALGVAAVGAATVGSAITGYRAEAASREARGLPQSRWANVGGALLHGMSGAGAAWGAFGKAKDHHWKAVTDDSIAKNNRHYNLFNQGASRTGTFDSRMRGIFGGDTRAQQLERQKDNMKSYADLYKHVAGKADVDGAWQSTSTDPLVRGQSVKALKEEFERVKLAGRPTAEIKAAEDRYKSAQTEYITDAINYTINGTTDYRTKSTDATTGTVRTGSQIQQVSADITEAETIRGSYETILGNTPISDAGDFKGRHFTASDRAYAIDHDPRQAGRKADDQAAGVGGKK